MNKVMYVIMSCVLLIGPVLSIGCSSDYALVVQSAGVVSEYGVYFGLKNGVKPDAKKTKVAQKSLEVAIKIAESESINDVVDFNVIIANLDEDIQKLIQPTFDKIDGKYVDLKNKIPQEKMPLIISILKGAKNGVDKYLVYVEGMEKNSDASVQGINTYEEDLVKRYSKYSDNL